MSNRRSENDLLAAALADVLALDDPVEKFNALTALGNRATDLSASCSKQRGAVLRMVREDEGLTYDELGARFGISSTRAYQLTKEK